MKVIEICRPVCPVCGESLELTRITTYRNCMCFWECPCLERLEKQIDKGELESDNDFFC